MHFFKRTWIYPRIINRKVKKKLAKQTYISDVFNSFVIIFNLYAIYFGKIMYLCNLKIAIYERRKS